MFTQKLKHNVKLIFSFGCGYFLAEARKHLDCRLRVWWMMSLNHSRPVYCIVFRTAGSVWRSLDRFSRRCLRWFCSTTTIVCRCWRQNWQNRTPLSVIPADRSVQRRETAALGCCVTGIFSENIIAILWLTAEARQYTLSLLRYVWWIAIASNFFSVAD